MSSFGPSARWFPGRVVSIRLGRAHNPDAENDRQALEIGSEQFKVNPDDLISAFQKSAWARHNILMAIAASSGDGTAQLPVEGGLAAILVNGHGEQLSEEWLSKALNRARKSAGLREELRLYDARGACVTRLVIADASLSEIAHHMGWGLTTAAKMIETYAAMDPDLSDSVLVKLDQIRNKTAK